MYWWCWLTIAEIPHFGVTAHPTAEWMPSNRGSVFP
jgi:hypothetical protein